MENLESKEKATSAIHIKEKVINFFSSNGSLYAKTPNKKDIVGPIYCKKPSFTRGILVAAALNHSRGMTVINPALIKTQDIYLGGKTKALFELITK